MAGSLNKVSLLGNVGKDPEIRTAQGGDKIANLSIATSETWKDKQTGEKKEKTEWHRVVVFNPGLVGVIESYVSKGSKVYLEGSLQTRKWTDQQGVEKYSTEVVLTKFNGTLVLCGDKPGGGDRTGRTSDRAGTNNSGGGGGWEPPADMDDEIPF